MVRHIFAVSLCLCVGVPLGAQMTVVKTLKPPRATKVAVVNVKVFFDEYWRAKLFKAQLAETLTPYKAKAKRLRDEIASWENEIRTGKLDAKVKQEREDSVRNNRTLLDQMGAEILTLVGKKQEENLVILWHELNLGISAVAKAYGFQIVFGYNDLEKADEFSHRSTNGKLQCIDTGAATPLYIDRSVDITWAVIDSLKTSIDIQFENKEKIKLNRP